MPPATKSGAPLAHWSEGLQRAPVSFDEVSPPPRGLRYSKGALAGAYQDLLAELPERRKEISIRTNGPGRPSIYSEALADEICDRLSNGETITDVCSDDRMPSSATISNWARTKPDFSEKYAHARRNLADWHANAALCAARGASADTVQCDRLKFDAHKWFAEKMDPRQYGQQKQQLDVNMSVDMNVTTLDVRALTIEQREQLKALLIAARDGSMKTIEHSPDDQPIESLGESKVIEG